MLLFSRQGKLRLQKWYQAYTRKEKKKFSRELISTILTRRSKMCNFLEYKDYKIVYKRLVCIPQYRPAVWGCIIALKYARAWFWFDFETENLP